MPAPTNTSAPLAIDLGSLPVSVVQQVDDSGITYTVWYKYTAQAGDKVIGLWGFGDLAVYQAEVTVYTGPASAPVQYLGIDAVNKRLQFPVTPGETYYFRFRPYGGGNPTPAILTVSGENAPDSNINYNGFLFNNDDSSGFLPTIINPSSGDVIKFIYPTFGEGEQGDSLVDGKSLTTYDTGDILRLCDFDFSLIANVAFPQAGGTVLIRGCLGGDNFYVANTGHGATHAFAKSVSKTGVLGSLIGPFALAGLTAIAASNDQTKLYYSGSGGGANSNIKVWNITGNIAAADLVAAIANYLVTDILVLSDNSILVMYYSFSVPGTKVIRYNAAGAILNTYDFGSITLNHPGQLAYALDDPNSFWTKIHLKSGVLEAYISRFTNIKVSDGSTLLTFDRAEYEDGVYSPLATATPLNKFGPAKGGAFFVLRNPINLTYNWYKCSGPGDVVFSDPNSLDTTATFGCSGVYVICLEVCNSCQCKTGRVTITVLPDCELPFPAIVFPGEGQGTPQHNCN